MIKLIGGPLDGYEADGEDKPLVGIPNSDLEITVPDPEAPDLTITHRYFISRDGSTAEFQSTSVFGMLDTGMVWPTVERPVLRPPS